MTAVSENLDEFWMRQALDLAHSAAAAGEVPVGAVLVSGGVVVGTGYNQPISAQDPSAHAEMIALRSAAQQLGNYRLPGTHLYSTLEPCPMCAGALIHARVEHLVYGARDEKWGACGSLLDIPGCQGLNHQMTVQGGVLEAEAANLLRSFFKARRVARASG